MVDDHGRRVVVPGGPRGCGWAAATRGAGAGYSVCLLDINEEALARAEQSVSGATEVVTLVGSSSDASVCDRAVSLMLDRFGGVDCVITSAGMVRVEPAVDVSPEDFRRTLEVNVTGSFLPARAAARWMTENGGGSIVMLGSVYGSSGAPNRTAYCASKGAVHVMVESLAVEWGPLGIRVNAVAPTGVRTPMVQDLIDQGKYNLKGVQARTPLGRLAEAEEVAAACLFLASPEASMTTGHILRVDGGWLANGYTMVG